MSELNNEDLERLYIDDLHKVINESKQKIRNYMKHTLRLSDTSQAMMRRLSWVHNAMLEDPSYKHKFDLLFKDITLPIVLARTYQSAYHHTHTISASALMILRPDVAGDTKSIIVDVAMDSIMPIASVSKDVEDVVLLENQRTVYLHLAQQLPKGIDKRRDNVTHQLKQLKASIIRIEAFLKTLGYNNEDTTQ